MNNDKPAPGIFKTVKPDHPTQDFNEWINYIYKEVEKKKMAVLTETENNYEKEILYQRKA